VCWGSLAVVVDVNEESMLAKVDFGDGILRDAIVGIGEERVSRGDIVLVHAGVIISKLSSERVMEQLRFLQDIFGGEGGELYRFYTNLLSLAESLKRGGSGG
jgi:hydrogenase expression/formation protein HypC